MSTHKIYRFPVDGAQGAATGGAAPLEMAQSYASIFWEGLLAWLSGPWAIGNWIGAAVLAGGLAFQIGFVSWFTQYRPRGPEYIHQIYSFLGWLVISGILAILSMPYVLFLEPFIGTFIGGSSVGVMVGRKPLLIVLNVVVTTVLLFTAVLPAIDGNYSDHMPYMYIVAESAFMTGWLFGMTYCITMAISSPGYPLAHIGLTPALVGSMCLLAAMGGAGMIKDWMIRCNTGEDGGGPWDGCTGALAGTGSSTTSSGAATSGCPCPGAGGNKCNCPFADDCSTNDACYNPGAGSIPSGCKHGCLPWG
jgi:hypothetical protein